jgi:hypothetical protein
MITKNDINKLFEEKIKKKLDVVQSEADTITGLINPFIDMLGYARDEYEDYRREYKAAYLGKKDAVDIALMKGMANPIVFIECKKYGHTFRKNDVGQLQHYHSAAKKDKSDDLSISILTDGDLYKLYTETKEINHLDDKPFIEFRISEINLCPESVINLINLMKKDRYDKNLILEHAYQNIYLNGIYETLLSEFKNPTEEFTRFLVKPLLHDNARLSSARVKEFFNPLVFQATQKLKNDLSGTEDIISPIPLIETTDSEVNGYRILLSLLNDNFDINRLIHEDTQDCFYIKIDGDQNKILCSFWFNNESNLKIGLYGEELSKVKKVNINSIEDIEKHKDALLKRIRFLEPLKLEPDKKQKIRKIHHNQGIYEGMSIENISNDKIVELPFGKGRFVLNDGRVMEGIWKGWKLVSGKTSKNGRVLSVKIKD